MKKVNNQKLENLDDPKTTIERKQIIQNKFFLKNCYINFYNKIKSEISPENKKGFIVELGSGAGFIQKVIKNTTTSDIMKLPGVDLHFSATKMPFKKNSVNAIVMVNVFHHIDDVEKFLTEAKRCLKENGQIIMIEPSGSMLGKFIYKNFHHEPFIESAKWKFASSGPLSSSNQALAWMVFARDKQKFKKKFPNFKIEKIDTHTPLLYLLSGGFTLRQLLPNSFYKIVKVLEVILAPVNYYLGLFYTISVRKIEKEE